LFFIYLFTFFKQFFDVQLFFNGFTCFTETTREAGCTQALKGVVIGGHTGPVVAAVEGGANSDT
jgi:hypothetical protein